MASSFKPSPNVTRGNTQASGSSHQFTGSVTIDGSLTVNGTPVGGGGGDVTGPGSSTENALALYDDATGKVLKNSGVIVDGTAKVSAPGGYTDGTATLLSGDWSGVGTLSASSNVSASAFYGGSLTTTGNTILGNAPADNHQVTGTLHISGGIMQQQYFSASISSPVNATCSLYNVFNYHLTANSEVTASSPVAGTSYLFFFRQDGTGARTVDFSGFKWPGGTAPTLSTAAGAVDIVSGISDGTNIYADTTKNFS